MVSKEQNQGKGHKMNYQPKTGTEVFKDKIDGNTLESTVATGNSGLIFDVTDNRTGDGAIAVLEIDQLRVLRTQIDNVIGDRKDAKPEVREVKTVGDLTSDHIGKRVRVEVIGGAVIEGSLVAVEHKGQPNQGWKVNSWVSFKEFNSGGVVSATEYTKFYADRGNQVSLV